MKLRTILKLTTIPGLSHWAKREDASVVYLYLSLFGIFCTAILAGDVLLQWLDAATLTAVYEEQPDYPDFPVFTVSF